MATASAIMTSSLAALLATCRAARFPVVLPGVSDVCNRCDQNGGTRGGLPAAGPRPGEPPANAPPTLRHYAVTGASVRAAQPRAPTCGLAPRPPIFLVLLVPRPLSHTSLTEAARTIGSRRSCAPVAPQAGRPWGSCRQGQTGTGAGVANGAGMTVARRGGGCAGVCAAFTAATSGLKCEAQYTHCRAGNPLYMYLELGPTRAAGTGRAAAGASAIMA